MRNILLAASAFAAIAIPTAASAQYYYGAPDTYGPPPAYVAPAPMVESQVYLGPGTTYVTPGAMIVPGGQYDDQAIYQNGQRYYRDCWWDWGRRRCELKPWW
jgi:hypothetical protein